jgi:hypothetical protein
MPSGLPGSPKTKGLVGRRIGKPQALRQEKSQLGANCKIPGTVGRLGETNGAGLESDALQEAATARTISKKSERSPGMNFVVDCPLADPDAAACGLPRSPTASRRCRIKLAVAPHFRLA